MTRERRVLVVEDDHDVREMMAAFLEDRCAVSVAENGSQALEMLTRHRRKFDALVVDLEMPGLSGTALLNELRGHGISTPVLIVSGMPDGRGLAQQAHAAFMSKPFDVDQFGAKVDELLPGACSSWDGDGLSRGRY